MFCFLGSENVKVFIIRGMFIHDIKKREMRYHLKKITDNAATDSTTVRTIHQVFS